MGIMQLKPQTRKTIITYAIVIVAFVAVTILDAVGLISNSLSGQLVPICAYVSLAVSLNLVVGVSGELSLGHAGFMSVGAFTGVVVAGWLSYLGVESDLVLFAVSAVAGAILAGIVGFLVGIPVMRLRGDYLAIVTLAFGEIIKNLLNNVYIGVDGAGLHFAMLSDSSALLFGDLAFSTNELSLTGPSGSCTLSGREAALLEAFLRNPGQTLSRELLLTKVWGMDSDVEDGNLDNYIHFLRRRLKNLNSSVHLQTVRGVGYRLER